MFQASSVWFEIISKSCGLKPSHLALHIPRVLLESFMKCTEMLESFVIQYGNPYWPLLANKPTTKLNRPASRWIWASVVSLGPWAESSIGPRRCPGAKESRIPMRIKRLVQRTMLPHVAGYWWFMLIMFDYVSKNMYARFLSSEMVQPVVILRSPY